MALAQATDPTPLEDACGADPSYICERVHDWTGSTAWAEAADKALATPAHILLVVVVAFVANRLVRRAIRRLTIAGMTLWAPPGEKRSAVRPE